MTESDPDRAAMRAVRPPPALPALLVAAAAALGACDGGGSSVPPGAVGPDSAADPGALYSDVSTFAGRDADGSVAGVLGAPGETVDCAATLPCRWIGQDSGFSVAVLRVDDTGRDGRLEMLLAVHATHDTSLGLALAEDALDERGSRASPSRVTLGDGRSAGTRALAAGERLEVRVDFDAPIDGARLPRWGLSLVDNGTVRASAFRNLPVGPLSGTPIDCVGRLPCAWSSDDGLANVELVDAGGFASERRLHVAFRVVATEPLALVAGPETVASSPSGEVFRARSQRLGTEAVAMGATTELPAGVPIEGRIGFFRTQGSARTLESVVLDLYRDAPVPRWRPRFENVPAVSP